MLSPFPRDHITASECRTTFIVEFFPPFSTGVPSGLGQCSAAPSVESGCLPTGGDRCTYLPHTRRLPGLSRVDGDVDPKIGGVDFGRQQGDGNESCKTR